METQTIEARTAPALSSESMRALLALTEAIVPGSARIPAADEQTLQRTIEVAQRVSPRTLGALAGVARLLDAASVAATGRRFSLLGAAEQQARLDEWQRSAVLRAPLTAVALAIKLCHFDADPVYAALGGERNAARRLEEPRWLSRVRPAHRWQGGDLECDVVVVGTGAGGAVAGKELAERGHAVVFVEEGAHHRRDAFDGSSVEAHFKFYRVGLGLGRAPTPILMGRLVGGSTAINGGSCFRTPSRVLERWCARIGTDALSPARMGAHFERVERTLQVAPAPRERIGPIGEVMARGCDALGLSHFAMLRNAPGCEGRAFCDFGCPTDARRSTNISYVPLALERGALLLTELHADSIWIEDGRAVGVLATDRDGRRMRVRAARVVLSAGGIGTPAFLLRQGLCNGSDQLGRNLAIQPSTGFAALFDEAIDPARHVPQGYGVDALIDEGILINSGLPDYNFAPMIFALNGRPLMDAIDGLERTASFALLSADDSQPGRVRAARSGKPLVTYDVAREDVDRLHRAMCVTADICRAAGARRLYPQVPTSPILEDAAALERFRRRRLSAGEIGLVAYHPLGTCKMGLDPRTSVVDLAHEAHELPGLHVVDASTVPGPPAVNPQITIMAMATRAADAIAQRLA